MEFKNKVFENGTIDGYTVIAIYGTKFFGSNKKGCPESLKNIKDETTCTTLILSDRMIYFWCLFGVY